MPKYTIVMPARNASMTIGPAIRSALRTFSRDAEVVVWDDGSTDNTAQIAGDIDPRRVRVLPSDVSIGGGAARQNILSASDSEFIVNQDADDLSFPWRHRIQSQLLEDADFVFSSVQRFSGGKKLHRPTLPLTYNPDDIPIALLFHNPLSHPTMIARRASLEDVGGYSDTRVAQDYELWLRAAAHGKKMRRSAFPCLAYRLSEKQVSQQPDYAKQVSASKPLRSAYGHVLQTQTAKTQTTNVLKYKDQPEILPNDVLYSLISKMSLHLRPYYKHIVRSGRYGHLGVVGSTHKDDCD